MSDPITYTLKRDAFGHPTNFKMKEETRPHELSIKSEPELERNFEQRNPKTITLTNITEKSCHMVKTDKTKMNTLEMRHVEGGWPDEVAHTKDPAQHKREIQVWKRRIGTSEEFSAKVKVLIEKTVKILKQNTRLDIYEDHFENNEDEHIEDDYSAKTKSVFKDKCKYKRTVNQLAMYIEEDQTKVVKGVGRFAVTYKLCKGQDVPPTEKLPCYIWDINNPNEPIRTISCNSQILSAAFHPKFQNLIACGCANGTTVVFDITEDNNKIIAASKIEESHREAVSSISWIKTKHHNEFVTTSTDRDVIFWTVVNFDKIGHPVTKDSPPIIITREIPCPLIDKETDKEYGGNVIEYNSESGPAKLLVGTEQGTVFTINKKKDEGGEVSQTKFGFKWGRHLGPIIAMQRCPDSLKYFLTIGDWTARIWFEEVTKTPILVSKFHSAYLTNGLWSKRPGIFFLSRNDGWIIAYDLCYKTNDSCFMYKVSESSITSMIINKEGDKILIGDEDGKVSMVKLSKSFYSISSNSVKAKQAFLNSFLEREVNKEKAIDALLNLKGKKKFGKDDANKQAKAEAALKERLRSIESEYMSYVNNMWNENYENKSHNEELHHQTSFANAVSISKIENTSVMQDKAETSKEKDQSKEESKVEEPHGEENEENKQEEQQNIYQTEENNERLNSSQLAADQVVEEEQKKEEDVQEKNEEVIEEDKKEEVVEEKAEERAEENVEQNVEEQKEEEAKVEENAENQNEQE